MQIDYKIIRGDVEIVFIDNPASLDPIIELKYSTDYGTQTFIGKVNFDKIIEIRKEITSRGLVNEETLKIVDDKIRGIEAKLKKYS